MSTSSAFDDLAAKLMTPAKSGAYLTRNELLVLARLTEGSFRFNERKRMLVDILQSAQDADGLWNMVERLREFWKDQLDRYTELAEAFPASAPHFAPWQQKARATLKALEKVQAEVRL